MGNWDIYKHTYSKGKCGICGAEGEICITEGIGRCHNCQVDWLIKKATE